MGPTERMQIETIIHEITANENLAQSFGCIRMGGVRNVYNGLRTAMGELNEYGAHTLYCASEVYSWKRVTALAERMGMVCVCVLSMNLPSVDANGAPRDFNIPR